MFWPGDYISGDDARLWDPVTNTLTSLSKARYDLFCAGHTLMSDGNLFVPGGNLLTPSMDCPTPASTIPSTNIWTRVPDMNAARWYPTTTSTGTGEVLVMTGTIDSVQLENPLPQVWQPALGDLAQSDERASQTLQLFLDILGPVRECLHGRPRAKHTLSRYFGNRRLDRVATFNFPGIT